LRSRRGESRGKGRWVRRYSFYFFISISHKMVQTISSYLFSVYNATLNYENPTLKLSPLPPLRGGEEKK
jgi:hypothetical protein